MHALRSWSSFSVVIGLALAVALGAGLAGCANGSSSARDSGARRRDAEVPPGEDGGSDPTDDVCGPAGNPCCAGRTCELGLRCGRGDVCCVGPGSPVACSGVSDCCTGLACQGGACCAPRGGSCSGASDCCTGLVCASGVCRNPETDDVDGPGPGGPGDSRDCGGPGGMCCAGFTCRAGNVCDGGTCRACGDSGEPCCDGASPCTRRSLSCDGTSCVEVSDPMFACGEIDQPCCDARGRPGGTDCTGDLTCSPGGRCIRSTDTGGMGEPCTPRGTCDGGLLCDRSSSPPSCTMPPADCGRDMQMCCDTNMDSMPDACEGSQSCQFGTCSMCRGPSLSCLLDGVPILGGGGCCNGSVCRPAPIVPRCCAGAGSRCTNSTDCCGFMQCRDGMCEAGREGQFCTDSSECGEGLTCRSFTCQPEDNPMGMGMGMLGDPCTSDMDCGMGFVCTDFQCTASGGECIESPMACTGEGSCCEGLACAPAPNEGEPTNPPPTRCCASADTACEDSFDCCGEMLCIDGACACQAEGSVCYSDQDCCEGFGCIGGNCVDVTGCGQPGQGCTSIGDCCGDQYCAAQAFGAMERFCGSGTGERCDADTDCVGLQRCVDGACECKRLGDECASLYDCCGALICIDGSCADATMT